MSKRRRFMNQVKKIDSLNITNISYNNFDNWRSGYYNSKALSAPHMAATSSICLNEKYEFVEIKEDAQYTLTVSKVKYDNKNIGITICQLNADKQLIYTNSLANISNQLEFNPLAGCRFIKISVAVYNSPIGTYDGFKRFWNDFYMEFREVK